MNFDFGSVMNNFTTTLSLNASILENAFSHQKSLLFCKPILQRLGEDLFQRNQIDAQKLSLEFIGSYSPSAMFIAHVLGLLSCWVISKSSTSRSFSNFSLYAADMFAFIAIFAVVFSPWKAFRFLYGLYFFASFLTLHGRIMEIVKTQSESRKEKITSAVGEVSKEIDSSSTLFFNNMIDTMMIFPVSLFKNSYPKLQWKRHLYLAASLASLDLCLYLIQEWIPLNIPKQNQYVATSLIGGIWVLLAVDCAYSVWIILFDLIGKPMSKEIRHRHPLLSTSLSEFWGVRWNPVIGRLLQESFYKPCRRLGVTRPVCILACFAGSASLHALPQFLATYHKEDSLMMGSFFVIQGVLLLLERITLEVTGFGKYFDEHLIPTKGGSHTAAPFQWAAETLTVLTLLAWNYYLRVSIHTVTFLDWKVLSVLTTASIGTFLAVLASAEASWRQGDYAAFTKVAICKFIGWLWVLSVIVSTLHLFSVPMVHALDTIYPQSKVIGPFISFFGSVTVDSIDLGGTGAGVCSME